MHQFVEAVAHDRSQLLDPRQHVPADEVGIEAREGIDEGDAGDRDAGAAQLGVAQHPLAVPRRDERQRVGVGVLDPGPLELRVEVVDVDEPGAPVVGGGGDRPRKRLLPELGGDHRHLPRLHVRTVDGEVGQTRKTTRHRQAILLWMRKSPS